MNEKAKNALKVVGEVLITPGLSLLIEGEIRKGALHAGLGLLGKAIFGLPAVVLLGASSYFNAKLAATPPKAAEGPSREYREGLVDMIHKGLAEGLTLEEIKAGIEEDVEDVFFEHIASTITPLDPAPVASNNGSAPSEHGGIA